MLFEVTARSVVAAAMPERAVRKLMAVLQWVSGTAVSR
jgi:hypothetical protein